MIEGLHKLSVPDDFVLRFDDGAQDIRDQLEREHRKLILNWESINKKLAAHIGKYNGLFVRLCIVWHCVDAVSNARNLTPTVTVDTAQRVASFLHGFLLRHAASFYMDTLGQSADRDVLQAIAGYILARKLTELTRTDMHHGDRRMRQAMNRKEADMICEKMEYFGWLLGRRSTGPNSWVWIVNPRVHELWAERGAEEQARRASIHEFIATEAAAQRRKAKENYTNSLVRARHK